jgi:hypothetical protein
MSGWQVLDDELRAWHCRDVTLWWRDDDACAASPRLARLLAIARGHRVPVAIAAVPAAVDKSLVDALAASDVAAVIQHGYAHRNHAPAGERSAELGAHRPLDERLGELSAGTDALAKLFGRRFRPVLVPPWNRIAADLIVALPATPLCALSCFGSRSSAAPAPGVVQANTHVDPIAWRRGRAFIGVDETLARIVAHLRARREARVDADEPTGLLTHHLAFDDAMFEFVDALCARTLRHPHVRWLGVDEVFAVTSFRSA